MQTETYAQYWGIRYLILRELAQTQLLLRDLRWLRRDIERRTYSPDQPRVPAGNGRASGQWVGNNSDSARRAGTSRFVHLAQVVPEPRRFLREEIEPPRINGQEIELDRPEEYEYYFGTAARNAAVSAARQIDPAYRSPAGLYSTFGGLMDQINAERDAAELFVINAKRAAYGVPPMTMEEFTTSYQESVRNVPTEELLAPGGRIVGWREGSARSYIRTVDPDTFKDLVTRLSWGQGQPSTIPRYEGVWYERGDGCVVGFRISPANGPTIDVVMNGNPNSVIPRNFKVHTNGIR